MNYFYDANIRKYLLQFIRIFGEFTIQKGEDNTGLPIYDRVPARYGDISRNVGHILKNNSENTLNTVPFISCYINNLEMNPDLRRYPQFEDSVQIIEKQFNEDTHKYDDEAGQSYTVTRYQPVPYLLTMTVDIWTSNTSQKLQLLEQILVLFNPSINLHTNQNTLDWTSLTYCELTNTQWSSRTLPSGADDVIDVATLTFQMPIYINPPVKVERMNLIHTILTQVHALDQGDFDTWTIDALTNETPNFSIVTLEDYWIDFVDGKALLLDKTGSKKDGVGGELQWRDDVFANYGELRPGISQLRLRQNGDVTDPTNDVIGVVDYDPNNDQKLLVTIDNDTLPTDTQGSVNAIINPQTTYPNDGTLPAAALGQRYLILDEVPSGSGWGVVNAIENDIIEYNGLAWVVSFSAANTTTTQYTTNIATGDKFEWTGEYWQNSVEGLYRQGWWRLYI